MKKYSEKALKKRKEERECLSKFYNKHIGIAKKQVCQECGTKLLGDVSEIAHRLPKSSFKSVMCLDSNVVYLCSWKSKNNCHSLYDGSNEQLQSLSIFPQEKEIIKQLLEQISEQYNYKLTDRWNL